jgi:hypothetical protein
MYRVLRKYEFSQLPESNKHLSCGASGQADIGRVRVLARARSSVTYILKG